jgi:glutathione S-transferase
MKGLMLKIWGRRNSFNVQKVLWLTGELGLVYEHIPAGGDFGRLDEAEFRGLNPHGRVPLLQDGNIAVWESHAILRYLGAKYGADNFWPDDPAVRSQIDAWMDWTETAFQPNFVNGIFWAYYRTPEAKRDWTLIRKNIRRCAEHLRLLDGIFAGRTYLAGETFSLADIALGTLFYRYFQLDVERPSAPYAEAWYHRLEERSAYREHVMTPFDDLYGRLAY